MVERAETVTLHHKLTAEMTTSTAITSIHLCIHIKYSGGGGAGGGQPAIAKVCHRKDPRDRVWVRTFAMAALCDVVVVMTSPSGAAYMGG